MRIAAILLMAWPALAAPALYVATTGSDSGDGSLQHPFATLEHARDAIRARSSSIPITVYLRGGVYRLARTFELDRRDSNTTWRAYPGERATLSGAASISGFRPWKGAILQADAAAFRASPFRQLYYAGKRQPLARYPNFDPSNPYGGGWAYADGAPVPMYQDVPGEDKRTLIYRAADARTWAHAEEGEVFVFPRYNWWNNIVRIESVDRERRRVRLAGDCSYPIRPGDRYYVQGLLEELDAPGEWYFDVRTGTLYFQPPEGAAAAGLTVDAPRLATLIHIDGARDVVFHGFTFEHSRGDAIVIANGEGCRIEASVVRNAGDYNGSGIAIRGGAHNGSEGNDIYDVGAHGVTIAGGDSITLTAADNYADNNYIHHTGVYYKQGVGVHLAGCGNRASHNLIHDTPRMAIMFSGTRHALEYNHLRHINLETADTGAVYTGGRDWLGSRGTVIRYNYMHDSLGYGQENGKWVSPHYSWGVYLDDNTGGVDVIGNIVVRAWRGLIHLHNGRDNLIRNNIFVEGKLQQAEFNGWTGEHPYWTSHRPTMIAGYNSVKDSPAWKGMRNMATGPEQAVLPNGQIMTGNVFERNIVAWRGESAHLFSSRNLPLDHNRWDANLYWHGGAAFTVLSTTPKAEWDFAAWRALGPDAHSVAADPLFVDWDHDDYRLRPESPAWKLGFERIPVERIGPYQDDRRASWPIVEAPGAREFPLR